MSAKIYLNIEISNTHVINNKPLPSNGSMEEFGEGKWREIYKIFVTDN